MPDKRVDPIPEKFSSLEEAGEFWDTHDTMDYPDDFTTIEGIAAELRNRYFEIEIEMSVAQALRERALQEGIPIRDLATEILRKQLTAA